MTANTAIVFLIWMMLAASVISLLASRFRIPYTVALVLGGLALGSLHLPVLRGFFDNPPDWLTPDIILVIFLPALLFESCIKISLRQLRENIAPISLLATAGVLISTLFTGFVLHGVIGMPLLVSLVFGAIVAATDPIAVIATFKSMSVNKQLAVTVEGESLFNDGTSVVLFGILVGAVLNTQVDILTGLRQFVVQVAGGIVLGSLLGYVFSRITHRIDDAEVEITLTTILAYGSYLLAHTLHLSGVIATVSAGLVLGNLGVRSGMSWRTRDALWSFWEYASFLINSVLFLLIGLQVHVGEFVHMWPAVLLSIAAVVVARVIAVYGLVPISNLFSAKIPMRWQHLLVWGGMRGALSLAMVLSLHGNFPYRDSLLTLTFGVVSFTIIVQGITLNPLLRLLGIGLRHDDEFSRTRVRQVAIASAISELEVMAHRQLISRPVYQQLHRELDARMNKANAEIDSVIGDNRERLAEEFKVARARLSNAEKGAIEQAMRDGWVSSSTASGLIAESHLQSFD